MINKDLSAATRTKKQLTLIVLSYATVYIAWGGTYFFISMAVQTIPPFYVVGFRFFGGGLLFLTIALFGNRLKRLPTVQEVGASLFMGIFLLLGGNGLVTLAEQSVDSYLAAMIISSTPMAVAFFDRVLIGKKISLVGFTGILAGMAGVGVLLYDGRPLSESLSPGILLVIAALVSWAFATSLGHRVKVFPDVFISSGIQMFFVGSICLSVMLLRQPLTVDMVASFSTRSITGVLYLAVVGSAAFVAYNFLIRNEPAMRVVSYAFVNPLIALFLGIVVGGETAKPYLVPGVVMILGGLFAMLYGDSIIRRYRRR